MSIWYDWRTDTIRFTTKTPRSKRGHWLRCGAHCKSTAKPCRARALANGRCKYHGGLPPGRKTLEGKARALASLHQFRRLRNLRHAGKDIVDVYTDALAPRLGMEPCA